MTEFDAKATAASLLEARRAGRRLDSLPASIAPRTEAEGVAAQHALARLMGAVPPAGFKIGATAKRMQVYLGLSGPAAGFMTEASVHGSGATIRFAELRNPGVECELAVRLARDLPPGPCTQAQAMAAVGDFMAGIEIVENRYGDLAKLSAPTMIADQVFNAAAVVGMSAAGWRTLDIPSLEGRLVVNGDVREQGVGADLLGHPMNCLAWLAGSGVAAAFGGLRAGQVVMLGSVTPPIWLDGPGQVTVQFDALPAVTVTIG